MKNTTRFIMLGGFLGAGKTTTIARLARTYQDQGLRVGIVTNDQAADLVDTHLLRSQGFHVGEVAGACFCCNFNDLTKTTDQLESEGHPDVILAEPVGSCTDLVATVVQPLMRLFDTRFEVAPYGVILKPSHGRRILKGEPNSGFSPKAAYIFLKQLEEADFVVINRVDQLSTDEVDELVQLVHARHPEIPAIRMSARTGAGFEQLLHQLEQQGDYGKRILDLDYDVYAEGEAELGWLNSSLQVTATDAFDMDGLLVDIVERLKTSLAAANAEAAHLKTIGLADGTHAVVNLVSSESAAELSLASDCQTRHANLIVNARVAIAPEELQRLVTSALDASCAKINATQNDHQTQSFRPGRPGPDTSLRGGRLTFLAA